MVNSLDSELKSLFAFYGEVPDSPEAPKAEDFFGLILSFSSSLQVGVWHSNIAARLMMGYNLQKAALEIHDVQATSTPKNPALAVISPPTPTETVRIPKIFSQTVCLSHFQTIKSKRKQTETDQTLKPPSDPYDRPGGRSAGRGDLDQAIRSMRTGKRRERPTRPLSKIFVDGGTRASRLFE